MTDDTRSEISRQRRDGCADAAGFKARIAA